MPYARRVCDIAGQRKLYQGTVKIRYGIAWLLKNPDNRVFLTHLDNFKHASWMVVVYMLNLNINHRRRGAN